MRCGRQPKTKSEQNVHQNKIRHIVWDGALTRCAAESDPPTAAHAPCTLHLKNLAGASPWASPGVTAIADGCACCRNRGLYENLVWLQQQYRRPPAWPPSWNPKHQYTTHTLPSTDRVQPHNLDPNARQRRRASFSQSRQLGTRLGHTARQDPTGRFFFMVSYRLQQAKLAPSKKSHIPAGLWWPFPVAKSTTPRPALRVTLSRRQH